MLDAALVCLATAVYFEARGEPFVGQSAVAHVVLNRVEDTRFPNDICSVVKQGPTYSWKTNFPIRNMCQFSYYRRQIRQTNRKESMGDRGPRSLRRDDRAHL